MKMVYEIGINVNERMDYVDELNTDDIIYEIYFNDNSCIL